MEQKREEGKERFKKKKKGGGGGKGVKRWVPKKWGSWLTLLRDLTNYGSKSVPTFKRASIQGRFIHVSEGKFISKNLKMGGIF